MKNLIWFLGFISFFSTYAQDTNFNLDFEQIKDGQAIDWMYSRGEGYEVALDDKVVFSGKYSASITSKPNAEGNFKAWTYAIPANYSGKKITLTGCLKTENVEGYAGLWLRIDPNVAFNNMRDRSISGTNDWQKYSITLDLRPDIAQRIVFGGLLTGKGKIWIDDLNLLIDGKPIEQASSKTMKDAEQDKTFDRGSGIAIPKLDIAMKDKLVLLGKIWGFLKYHHPAVAKGNYNWDYKLFRFLPEYLQSTPQKRDEILLRWIDDLGEVKPCISCEKTPETAFLKPNFKWLDEHAMSKALKQKIEYIRANRWQYDATQNSEPHYYIGSAKVINNPEFKHENDYANMPYPDEGFRLLALYRYWNIIHYFFPYIHLMDEDWNDILQQHLASFVEAENELEYELAMLKIIAKVQDTHANLWRGSDAIQQWRGQRYAPIKVRFIENKLVVTDYYQVETGTQDIPYIGDVVTEINGKKVADIIKAKLEYYPASNYPTQLRDIARDMLRSNDDRIEITYTNVLKGEITTKISTYFMSQLRRYIRHNATESKATSYKMLKNNIGYITLENIKETDIEAIKKAFKNTKGIVVDIRNYPATFVVYSLGSFFTSSPTAFVQFTKLNIHNPGEFNFTKTLSVGSYNEQSYKGKVVVLVDERTQSQAEFTTMAFQTGDNVAVIGSTTAAADGNISYIPLPGGLQTAISGIGVYYPDGTETQRIGIVPDIAIEPTINGIRAGKDELLEKAIDVIETSETPLFKNH